MIVVSDATPLNILIRLGRAGVLPALFARVTVPRAVIEEMTRPATPEAVRRWAANPPNWLTIADPPAAKNTGPARHRGERAVMELALAEKATLVLIDDRAARRRAATLGLTVAGTVAVLEAAADVGLIDLAAAHDALRQTDFRVKEDLLADSLVRHLARRQPDGEPD